ncbi:FAD-dependent oxidoreductase [Nocardioides carbamazepini]|uniref:NAD(P)/FAD-dependent oxidoreductase n=1 Tax=Nocardioides carbamazepini TaxID=2854259 RepID=UPI00214A5FD6|nr:FAD-dependent oxidoreductase [Nocardioides carbamazepini]MCR1786097.1 FAD-dependent oxidoreductase [Nocardioides carbamazepini]
MAPRRIVIVGASLAGLRVAEGLRSHGYLGEVVLIGDEDHPPYDRPPLSKQVLSGTWEPSRTYFRTPDELAARGIVHRRRTRATSLDRDVSGGVVRCADGTEERFDHVVVATGARARRVGAWELPGVQTLRTIEDVRSLTEAFARRPRLTVVGGGFIGAEVASAARHRGLDVTLVEALPAPLSRVLGTEVGMACAGLYRRNGVRVLTGVAIEGVQGGPGVESVDLTDGTRIDSDLVVVGIGAVPNTEWADGGGLRLDGGIVCDASGGAGARVWAVGDVARWYHPVFDAHIRVEHWTHATEQAHHVARAIAGQAVGPMTAIPYAWSDQFGVKIQIVGRPSPDATFVLASGTPEQGRFVGLYAAAGRVVGGVGFDQPRAIARVRRMVAGAAEVGAAVQALAG